MNANASDKKPLVTIFMMTYNQEKYVRDAVRGLLSQTYEPLEIIISDDCSTDRTWEIISKEVADYKASGGIHKNIVQNRNEENLGVARHSEVVERLGHGIICVGSAGDDISLPNRVERIVEAWKDGGESVMAISHSGYTIDVNGNRIGFVRQSSLECPLGAVMAWKRLSDFHFPSNTCAGASEDVIAACRAMMLGKELVIPDKLILYRIGSGVTSVLDDQRGPSLRGMIGWYKAYSQVFSDLEYLKEVIGNEKYNYYRDKFTTDKEYVGNYIKLLTEPKFIGRVAAYRKIKARNRRPKQRLLTLIYLLPKQVGDILLNVGSHIKSKVRILKNRHMCNKKITHSV